MSTSTTNMNQDDDEPVTSLRRSWTNFTICENITFSPSSPTKTCKFSIPLSDETVKTPPRMPTRKSSLMAINSENDNDNVNNDGKDDDDTMEVSPVTSDSSKIMRSPKSVFQMLRPPLMDGGEALGSSPTRSGTDYHPQHKPKKTIEGILKKWLPLSAQQQPSPKQKVQDGLSSSSSSSSSDVSSSTPLLFSTTYQENKSSEGQKLKDQQGGASSSSSDCCETVLLVQIQRMEHKRGQVQLQAQYELEQLCQYHLLNDKDQIKRRKMIQTTTQKRVKTIEKSLDSLRKQLKQIRKNELKRHQQQQQPPSSRKHGRRKRTIIHQKKHHRSPPQTAIRLSKEKEFCSNPTTRIQEVMAINDRVTKEMQHHREQIQTSLESIRNSLNLQESSLSN